MGARLTPKEAKEKAGRFCAFRERSPNEVLEKIISWGLSRLESEKIVEELIALNYIDELRFATAYCHDKFEFNSWGKQKIKAAIYSHKLPSSTIEKALQRIDADKYNQRLYELAEKKWERLTEDSGLKKKQKLLNYLVSKGFEMDLILKTLTKLEAMNN